MDHDLIARTGDVVRIGEYRLRIVSIEAERVLVQIIDDGDVDNSPMNSGDYYALVFRAVDHAGVSPARMRVELQAV